MSFMDNITKMASGLFGGNAAAGQEGTGQTDVAAEVQQHLGSMDPATLTALGTTLMSTFTSHTAYQGDGAQAAAAAGTTPEAVASGSPNAVASLISYAQQNPQVMSACMTAFQERNPAALAQFAPGLIAHLTGKG